MTYDDLPDQIRAIIPRDKVAAVRRGASASVIRVMISYDQRWDTYVLRGGRWTYQNPDDRSKP